MSVEAFFVFYALGFDSLFICIAFPLVLHLLTLWSKPSLLLSLPFFFSKKTKREKNPAIAKHINLESKLCHCIEGLHFYLKNNIPQYLNSISLDIICWDLLYPKILITSNILGTKNSDFCLISRNTFLYHFQRIE